MTIDQFTDALMSHLDADFSVFHAGDQPPSHDDIRSMQSDLAVSFPEDYLAFQARYGAAYFEVKESAWPRPKLYAVGPYWSFIFSCKVLGIGSPELPDWLNIRIAFAKFMEQWSTQLPFRLVPVLGHVGAADWVCVDERGLLFSVSHETPGEPERIESGFLDYLLSELAKLAHNKGRLRIEVPQLFETDADRMERRGAEAAKDAALTDLRCPSCGSPCPSYRKTCKVCGKVLGQTPG